MMIAPPLAAQTARSRRLAALTAQITVHEFDPDDPAGYAAGRNAVPCAVCGLLELNARHDTPEDHE